MKVSYLAYIANNVQEACNSLLASHPNGVFHKSNNVFQVSADKAYVIVTQPEHALGFEFLGYTFDPNYSDRLIAAVKSRIR